MDEKQAKQLEKEYVESGGNFCPHCKSNNITSGKIEAGSNSAWAIVNCLECGEIWEDVYNLVGVSGLLASLMEK